MKHSIVGSYIQYSVFSKVLTKRFFSWRFGKTKKWFRLEKCSRVVTQKYLQISTRIFM